MRRDALRNTGRFRFYVAFDTRKGEQEPDEERPYMHFRSLGNLIATMHMQENNTCHIPHNNDHFL